MNSTISDDLTREQLALDAAQCIEKIFGRTQNLTGLQKELLEINLSITAYIQESKKRLEGLRLALAHEAKSSQKVVEILSEKCKFSMRKIMSSAPTTPCKRNTRINIKSLKEDNNNTSNKFSERQQARTFIQWYKRMIDNERQNLALYLSDDATLEWFGRTIKTRKKVSTFLRHDMQCSRHDFTTVDSIDKIQTRQDIIQRKEDVILASPLHSPELKTKERCSKRRLLRSNCNSPEWAEGYKPDNDFETKRKRTKTDNEPIIEENNETCPNNLLKREFPDDPSEIGSKGDGVLGRRLKRKCVPVTPPNREVGQGDCIPSTSGTDSNKSHDALNSQLPKQAVECNGYIEFTRTRNNRSTDAMKWERKCKVQVSYSEDPLNVGEYIIWALRYTDDSKCRRNLLAAFEEVSMDDEAKNV